LNGNGRKLELKPKNNKIKNTLSSWSRLTK
jgi:hypothetical protein